MTPHEIPAPSYVCDLDRARTKYEMFRASFARRFSALVVGYSYKTNYVPRLCRTFHELGAWAEVVSATELELARTLGVPWEKIIFNGPVKTLDHLRTALAGGATVNLESLEEARAVASLPSGEVTGRVGLRVNVPLGPGGLQSRFGLSAETGELQHAIGILGDAGVPLRGLHAHVSSKARSLDTFRATASALAEVAPLVGGLEYLDVGGGFGYADSTAPFSFPSFDEYADAIHESLASRVDLERISVIAEPGMALVADCFSFLGNVVSIKRLPGRTLLVTDASVHTVKPTLHRYNPPTTVLRGGGVLDGQLRRYDISGYTCMETDVIAQDIELPEVRSGDVLRFGNVGAYTLVFKPPFIQPHPPIYTTEGGLVALAREGQSFDDFIRGYVDPAM